MRRSSHRRPSIELDDLERAARRTLAQLRERRDTSKADRGTRLCLLVQPDELRAIGLPRWIVAADIAESLNTWAALELPSRAPIDVELDQDASLKPGEARVWLLPGRARPAIRTAALAQQPQDDPAPPKRDRIARAGGNRRGKPRGYSAMATLRPRSNQATRRRRAGILALAVATLLAALLFLAGPALADVHAEPGPAPDVSTVEQAEAAAQAPVADSGDGWLPLALLTLLGVVGTCMALYGIYKLLHRRGGVPAESFPDTIGHQMVDEGIRARQQGRSDAAVMLHNVRSVRDAARAANDQPAVDASVKLEHTLQRIRQHNETMPAGRLAASSGRVGHVAAALDSDQDAARALQTLSDDLIRLRRQTTEVGASGLASALARLQSRADDVRDKLTRRPELIQD